MVRTSLLALALSAPQASAQSGQRLGPAHRAELVKDLTEGLSEVHVFPEVAEEMNALIEGKLERGEYDHLSSLRSFTEALTADLQSISQDKHPHVSPTSPRLPEMAGSPTRRSCVAAAWSRPVPPTSASRS
jgi:hypothetical protein